MPIGGFVITFDLSCKDNVLSRFSEYPQLEVHGVDAQGNSVVVIDTESSAELEELVSGIGKIDGVLSVGATFFHAEDEIEKIARGELKPTFSFGRKGEKPAGRA